MSGHCSCMIRVSFITCECKKRGHVFLLLPLCPHFNFSHFYFYCCTECQTYSWETWSGHILSDPSPRSGRSPRGRRGWRCQNLMQDKNLINAASVLLLPWCSDCTANTTSDINTTPARRHLMTSMQLFRAFN